jgi:nicotinamidase-related amidase
LILLIINPQNDFHPKKNDVRPAGTLAVNGATEDAERIAELIKTGLNNRPFDQIIVTLDTHNVNHIAHASFWKSKNSGESPPPFIKIFAVSVGEEWVPRDESLTDYCKKYCSDLEKKGNYTLMIWPHHCIQGTTGHAVVSEISKELFDWSVSTGKTVDFRQKGQNNLTEMYSVIEAEVPLDSDPKTAKNEDLLSALLDPSYDYNKKPPTIFHSDSIRAGEGDVESKPISFEQTKVFICGQAMSHCVKGSTNDIIKYATNYNIKNLILLQNCASPVADFEKQATDWVTNVSAQITVANA